MLRKGDGKKVSGYFTVEASLVVPLIIFLIGLLFYLTFYLYDRCVAAQDAYLLAFRGSACSGYSDGYTVGHGYDKSPEEIKQLVIGQCTKQFGEKYMGIHTFISTVQADKKKVSVEASGSMTAAFTEQLLPQKDWHFAAKKEAERICPTECIRKARIAKKVTDQIKESIGNE